MSKTISEFIDQYRAEGLSFFPIPSRSKQATTAWKEYQDRLPTDSEIQHWKSNGTSNLAVVCGAVSGNLVVIDFDSQDKFFSYCDLLLNKNIDLFTYTRLVRTSKGMHVYFRLPATIKSTKFPQVDLKAEGGYVIAPPSIHPSGSPYELVNSDVPIRQIASLTEVGIDVTAPPPETQTQPGQDAVVPEGNRNQYLTSLGGTMRRRGMTEESITAALLAENKTKCNPPLPESEVVTIAKSVSHYAPNLNTGNKDSLTYSPFDNENEIGRDKSVTKSVTRERIEEWIRDQSGWFSYEDVDKEFGIRSDADKANRRQIIKRLREPPSVIEPHPKNAKLFRYINQTVRLIDFKSVNRRTPLAIKYPFGLEHYYNTYPGNVIVVAGSPDAGKTAFLLNLIRENMHDFSIFYQSSEMGKDELASRLEMFEGIGLDDWNFTAEERSSNFADTIRPDCINIIDYMEFGDSSFYMIAEYLRQIHEKLDSGIAVVALQKARGAELGRGKEFGLEKPRLYLSMDAGKIKIQKAKNWTHPEENPNGLVLNFKIVGGCKFIITEDWHKENE